MDSKDSLPVLDIQESDFADADGTSTDASQQIILPGLEPSDSEHSNSPPLIRSNKENSLEKDKKQVQQLLVRLRRQGLSTQDRNELLDDIIGKASPTVQQMADGGSYLPPSTPRSIPRGPVAADFSNFTPSLQRGMTELGIVDLNRYLTPEQARDAGFAPRDALYNPLPPIVSSAFQSIPQLQQTQNSSVMMGANNYTPYPPPSSFPQPIPTPQSGFFAGSTRSGNLAGLPDHSNTTIPIYSVNSPGIQRRGTSCTSYNDQIAPGYVLNSKVTDRPTLDALRFIQFPLFTGKRGDFRGWSSSMIEMLHLRGIPREHWARVTRAHVQGSAKEFLMRYDDGMHWTFEDLIEHLSKEYMFENDNASIMTFNSIRQQDNEGVASFCERLEKSYQAAFPEIPAAEPYRHRMLCFQAMHGLKSEIRDQMRGVFQISRFQNFKDEAKACEAYIRFYHCGYLPKKSINSNYQYDPNPVDENRPPPKKVSWNVNEITVDDWKLINQSIEKRMEPKIQQVVDLINVLDEKVHKHTPRIPQPSADRGENFENGCYHCGKLGHYARTCPKKIHRYGSPPADRAAQTPYYSPHEQGEYYNRGPIPGNKRPAQDPEVLRELRDRQRSIGNTDPYEPVSPDHPLHKGNLEKKSGNGKVVKVHYVRSAAIYYSPPPSKTPRLQMVNTPQKQVTSCLSFSGNLDKQLTPVPSEITSSPGTNNSSALLRNRGNLSKTPRRLMIRRRPRITVAEITRTLYFLTQLFAFSNLLAFIGSNALPIPNTNSSNYKESAGWTFRPKTQQKPFSEVRMEQKFTPFNSIFSEGRLRLGARINLNLGAAIVPDGLTIITSTRAYLPLIVELTAPQWIPVKLRTDEWQDICENITTSEAFGLKDSCLELLDPILARKQCPSTLEIQDLTDELLEEVRQRFQSSINPMYYAQLLYDLCKQHKHLCVQPYETTKQVLESQFAAKKSTKREIHNIILNATVTPSITGRPGTVDFFDVINHPNNTGRTKRALPFLAFSIFSLAAGMFYNMASHSSLSSTVEKLVKNMNQFQGQLDTIRNSVTTIRQGLVNLTRITAQGFEHVYDVIEATRCSITQGVENTQVIFTAEIYRNYLYTHLEAIMEMSRTGKVSPLLIGVDRLKTIIQQNSNLRESLLGKEISLFYQHAKGYPVKLDFQSFRFGFILEIPLPTKKEVHISYKIYNVGFHGTEISERGSRRRVLVHRAPLPARAISHDDGTLAPLDLSQCSEAGGIGLCTSGALTLEKPSPCLMLLTDPDCKKHCKDTDDCLQEIEVYPMPAVAEVAMTPAGTLIRAPFGDVAIYNKRPDKYQGQKPNILEKNPERTYYLPGNETRYFVVDERLYAPQLSTAVVTKIFDTAEINISRIEIPHPTTREEWDKLLRSFSNDPFVGGENAPYLFFKANYNYFLIVFSTICLMLGLAGIILTLWCRGYLNKFTNFCCRRFVPYEKILSLVPPSHPCKDPKNLVLKRRDVPTLFFLFDQDQFGGWFAALARKRGRRLSTAGLHPDPSIRRLKHRDGYASDEENQRQRRPLAITGAQDGKVEYRRSPPGEWAQAKNALGSPPLLTVYVLTIQQNFRKRVFSFLMSDNLEERLEQMDRITANVAENDSLGLTAGFDCEALRALIDTGAQVTMVTKKLAQQIGAKIHDLDPETATAIQSASRRVIPMAGYIFAGIFLCGNVYHHKFFVRNDEDDEGPVLDANIVLGTDFMIKIGKLIIDFHNKKVVFEDRPRNRSFVFPMGPLEEQLIIRCGDGYQTFHVGGAGQPGWRRPRSPGPRRSDSEDDSRGSRSRSTTPRPDDSTMEQDEEDGPSGSRKHRYNTRSQDLKEKYHNKGQKSLSPSRRDRMRVNHPVRPTHPSLDRFRHSITPPPRGRRDSPREEAERTNNYNNNSQPTNEEEEIPDETVGDLEQMGDNEDIQPSSPVIGGSFGTPPDPLGIGEGIGEIPHPDLPSIDRTPSDPRQTPFHSTNLDLDETTENENVFDSEIFTDERDLDDPSENRLSDVASTPRQLLIAEDEEQRENSRMETPVNLSPPSTFGEDTPASSARTTSDGSNSNPFLSSIDTEDTHGDETGSSASTGMKDFINDEPLSSSEGTTTTTDMTGNESESDHRAKMVRRLLPTSDDEMDDMQQQRGENTPPQEQNRDPHQNRSDSVRTTPYKKPGSGISRAKSRSLTPLVMPNDPLNNQPGSSQEPDHLEPSIQEEGESQTPSQTYSTGKQIIEGLPDGGFTDATNRQRETILKAKETYDTEPPPPPEQPDPEALSKKAFRKSKTTGKTYTDKYTGKTYSAEMPSSWRGRRKSPHYDDEPELDTRPLKKSRDTQSRFDHKIMQTKVIGPYNIGDTPTFRGDHKCRLDQTTYSDDDYDSDVQEPIGGIFHDHFEEEAIPLLFEDMSLKEQNSHYETTFFEQNYEEEKPQQGQRQAYHQVYYSRPLTPPRDCSYLVVNSITIRTPEPEDTSPPDEEMDIPRTPSPQEDSQSDYSNIQSISPSPPNGITPLAALEKMVESIPEPSNTEENPVAYPFTPGFSNFSLATLFDCESEKPVESSTPLKTVENSSSSSSDSSDSDETCSGNDCPRTRSPTPEPFYYENLERVAFPNSLLYNLQKMPIMKLKRIPLPVPNLDRFSFTPSPSSADRMTEPYQLQRSISPSGHPLEMRVLGPHHRVPVCRVCRLFITSDPYRTQGLSICKVCMIKHNRAISGIDPPFPIDPMRMEGAGRPLPPLPPIGSFNRPPFVTPPPAHESTVNGYPDVTVGLIEDLPKSLKPGKKQEGMHALPLCAPCAYSVRGEVCRDEQGRPLCKICALKKNAVFVALYLRRSDSSTQERTICVTGTPKDQATQMSLEDVSLMAPVLPPFSHKKSTSAAYVEALRGMSKSLGLGYFGKKTSPPNASHIEGKDIDMITADSMLQLSTMANDPLNNRVHVDPLTSTGTTDIVAPTIDNNSIVDNLSVTTEMTPDGKPLIVTGLSSNSLFNPEEDLELKSVNDSTLLKRAKKVEEAFQTVRFMNTANRLGWESESPSSFSDQEAMNPKICKLTKEIPSITTHTTTVSVGKRKPPILSAPRKVGFRTPRPKSLYWAPSKTPANSLATSTCSAFTPTNWWSDCLIRPTPIRKPWTTPRVPTPDPSQRCIITVLPPGAPEPPPQNPLKTGRLILTQEGVAEWHRRFEAGEKEKISVPHESRKKRKPWMAPRVPTPIPVQDLNFLDDPNGNVTGATALGYASANDPVSTAFLDSQEKTFGHLVQRPITDFFEKTQFPPNSTK